MSPDDKAITIAMAAIILAFALFLGVAVPWLVERGECRERIMIELIEDGFHYNEAKFLARRTGDC